MQDGNTIDLDNLTPEDFAAMDDAQRQAILSGEGLASEQQAEAIQQQGDPTAEAQPTAEQIAAEQAVAEQAQAQTQAEQQAQPTVPLPALHEERQRRQQLQQILQDPNALAQHLAQMGYQVMPQGEQQAPELAFEDPAVIDALVAQRVAPLEQKIAAYEQERQMLAYQQRIEAAIRDIDPDAATMIAEFDQALPQLSGLDPYVKAATIHGLRWADPEYRQAQIDKAADEKAAAKLAEQLAGSKKSPPVTLAGVTAATANETPLSVEEMSFDDWSKLPADKREALLRGDTAFS